MPSSRSHTSLATLPVSFEALNLNNRTASSTPASIHKHDQAAVLTPPSAPDSFLASRPTSRNQSTNRSLYGKSKYDDDVFGGGAKLPSESQTQASTCRDIVEHLLPTSRITPRSDRLLVPITAQNAQGVLPPDARVFVANLAVNRTVEQLEESVHAAFDPFGRCEVIVKQDRHHHPYAIVQYHTVEDATTAIEGSGNMFIDDRKIRTERSVSQCSVILYRTSGGEILDADATRLLGRYGPIAEISPTMHADARKFGIPEGVRVRFAYYSDFRDCFKFFNRTSSLYKVMEVPKIDPRTRPATVPGGSPVAQGLRTTRSTTDQKSIFLGNLPGDIADQELVHIFEKYGEIKGCNIIRKAITGGQGFNIFGFMEFSTVAEAEAASQLEIDIRGQRIRVEPKEYSARRHTRLQPFAQPTSVERSRAIAWGPSNNVYRSPPAAMPYGFQPIYIQQSPTGISPFYQGHPWAATPPSSGQRRRATSNNNYIFAGSPPQQYIPIDHSAYAAMTQWRGNEAEGHEHPSRRYR